MFSTTVRQEPIAIVDERIIAATADIRNALVPLRTIASLLHDRETAPSQEWCAWMLEREVKRIVEILDQL